MTRFFSSLIHSAIGPLLWLNVAILVLIKVALPLGGLGMAAIVGYINPPDSVSIVAETNAARSSLDLPTLKRNTTLDVAAEKKLNDMAANGYFAHVSPSGQQAWDFISASGYRYAVAGENLARGFSDPAALVAAWMKSPSHRANLLNSAYRDVGVAVGRITLNGKPATVVIELFATPRMVAAAPPIPAPAAGGQRVSTQTAIAPVSSPVPVTEVAGATSASIPVSNVFGVYLAVLLGLLTMAAGWVRWNRRIAVGWLAHAGIAVALVALPQLLPTVAAIF